MTDREDELKPLLYFTLTMGLAWSANIAQGIEAFRAGLKIWSIEKFDGAEKFFDSATKEAPTEEALYWQSVVQFHKAQYYLFGTDSLKNDSLGEKAVVKGIQSLEALLEQNPKHAEAHALYGTLLGIEISVNFWSVFANGSKIWDSMNLAVEEEPENPRIQYLIGVSYLFTPALLGGGTEKGRSYLLEAVRLYDKEQSVSEQPLAPSWGEGLSYGFLAYSYLQEENFTKANHWAQKGLIQHPENLVCLSALKESEKRSQ